MRRDILGGLDFHVYSGGPLTHRIVEDAKLLLDASVEAAVVLVTPAGGQDRALWMSPEEFRDGGKAGLRVRQVIEAKLEKLLTGFDLGSCVLQQCLDVLKSERDAYGRKSPAQ